MKRRFVILCCLISSVSYSLCTSSVEEKGDDALKISNPTKKFPYKWECRDETCEKVRNDVTRGSTTGMSLDACKLNCAKAGSLWPIPTGEVQLGQELLHFHSENVVFTNHADSKVNGLLETAKGIFLGYLDKMLPEDDVPVKCTTSSTENDFCSTSVLIDISVAWPDEYIKLGLDESYTLSIVPSNDQISAHVTIVSNTYFGARHALETLSQLITYNERTESLSIIHQATISDKPFYTYRGLTIDTSRSFIPLSVLRRIVDGMSFNKLNYMHWHITDTHSFPFESKRQPLFYEYGAYSSKKIYTVDQMKELLEYARIRGVKILPEFDAPSHVGNGWQWGPEKGLGNLAVCVNQDPWENFAVEPPAGQLNPVNENMYTVLGELYKDFMDIFAGDLFHMGGDEVMFNCWNTTEEIVKWLTDNGHGVQEEDYVYLWAQFQSKAYELLKIANQGKDLDAILWTSHLTSEKYITQYVSNKTYIVQIWTNGNAEAHVIPYLIQNGYRTIFSQVDAWYLDCGYGAWVGSSPNNWCSPYKGWQTVYSNDPIKILATFTGDEFAKDAYKRGLILGGEAAMWSEQTDGLSIETKIWPRGCALAERVWSNPSSHWLQAEGRINQQRQRLVERGLTSDLLQPEWCRQNEKKCILLDKKE